MKWGGHEAMEELRSPDSIVAGRCLVPRGLGSPGLGGAQP